MSDTREFKAVRGTEKFRILRRVTEGEMVVSKDQAEAMRQAGDEIIGLARAHPQADRRGFAHLLREEPLYG